MKWANSYHHKHSGKWHTVQCLSYTGRHKALHQSIRWCKQYKSDGKFYYHYNPHPIWYFENKDDALIFALKWS